MPPLHLISSRFFHFVHPYTIHFPLSRSFPLSIGTVRFCSVNSNQGSSVMAAPEPVLPVKDRIEVSQKEDLIFRRLLEVLRHFGLQTQLRVAGGWVRDKLLGKECYDIDIALDDMLGNDFCEKINEYSLSLGEEQHKIGFIKSNPDQSKHLETATMRIYDTWIDFVNLRSETYAENSRIPTMKFGTAEEDAYRRDLTINSLFYNVNNRSVEDLTGRGIKDLKSGLIITPLPPKTTFMDDPLRVLRAIRFGARFNFKLDEELKTAAFDNEVRSAFANKISRARIGREVDLMMKGKQPAKAMGYIRDLKLFLVVFAFPENPKPPIYEHCDRICVSHIEAAWDLLQLMGPSTFKSEILTQNELRRLYLYGSLFAPLRSKDKKSKDKKSKEITVVGYIIKKSLELGNSVADTVVKLHGACEKFLQLFALLESNEGYENIKADLEDEFLEIPSNMVTKVFAGVLLGEIKDFWRVALLISVFLKSESDLSSIDKLKEPEELNKQREIFLRVETAITQLDLDGVWKMKPLLDGNVVMKILKLDSGNQEVGYWTKRVTKWQLANPKGTTEECISWMKKSILS